MSNKDIDFGSADDLFTISILNNDDEINFDSSFGTDPWGLPMASLFPDGASMRLASPQSSTEEHKTSDIPSQSTNDRDDSQIGLEGQIPFNSQNASCIPQNDPHMPQSRPPMTQGFLSMSQNCSSMPQNCSFMPQGFPSIPQNCSSIPQGYPYIPQNYLPMPQSCPFIPQNCPLIPQCCPSMPQNCPLIPQCCPSMPQNCPFVPQNFSFVPQCCPSMPQNCPFVPQNRLYLSQKGLKNPKSTAAITHPNTNPTPPLKKTKKKKSSANKNRSRKETYRHGADAQKLEKEFPNFYRKPYNNLKFYKAVSKFANGRALKPIILKIGSDYNNYFSNDFKAKRLPKFGRNLKRNMGVAIHFFESLLYVIGPWLTTAENLIF